MPVDATDPTGNIVPLILLLFLASLTAEQLALLLGGVIVVGGVAYLLRPDGEIVELCENVCAAVCSAECFNFARKEDIRLMDRIARDYGLTREQRRRLHDEMKTEKCGRDNLPENEIIELLCLLFPDKC